MKIEVIEDKQNSSSILVTPHEKRTPPVTFILVTPRRIEHKYSDWPPSVKLRHDHTKKTIPAIKTIEQMHTNSQKICVTSEIMAYIDHP